MRSWVVRRSRSPRGAWSAGIALAAAGLAVPLSAATVQAAVPVGACGSVLMAGSTWLNGVGVDVSSNGTDEGSTTSCAGSGTYGLRYQSAELVNRLYRGKSWTTKTWAGTGGRSTSTSTDSLYDLAPLTLAKQAEGSISYVGPGDVVSVNVYVDGAFVPNGQALVVNTSAYVVGGTVPLVGQNGGDSSGAVTTQAATLSNGSLSVAPSGGHSYQVIGVVHAPGGQGAPPPTDSYYPVSAVTDTSGRIVAKATGFDATWVTEKTHARQVAVASDAAHGPTVAVLTNDGTVLARTGALDAPWVTEATGISQVAIASDPTHGPTLAVVTDDGTVLAKTGDLDAAWVTQLTGARQVAVASDAVHGPLFAVLLTDGTVQARTGGSGALWVPEMTNVRQVSVATDPTDGPLLAVLTNDGTVQAKGGALDASWISELDHVRQMAVASDRTFGPLVAVLTNDGRVLAKQGALNSQWTTLTQDALQVSVASDPKKGPTIDVLHSDRSVVGKIGTLGAKWATLRAGGGSLSAQLRDPGVLIKKTRPSIHGKPIVGKVLKAVHGRWTPGSLTYHYQWLAGRVAIPGATHPKLHLKKGQSHKRITLRVITSRVGYTTARSTSHPTHKVAKG